MYHRLANGVVQATDRFGPRGARGDCLDALLVWMTPGRQLGHSRLAAGDPS